MQNIPEKKISPKSQIALIKRSAALLTPKGLAAQFSLNSTKDKKAKGKQGGFTLTSLGLEEKKKRALLLQRINLLRVGDFCELKITALGPKGVGIDEFSYGYSILIPNAKLGETVKAQIIKLNLKKAKYAVAKKVSVLNAPFLLENKDAKPNLNVGDILTVKLNHIAVQTDSSFIGIVDSDLNLPIKYQLLIPLNNVAQVGQEIKIQVTRIKLKYGFAKIVAPESLKNVLSSTDSNTNRTNVSLAINNQSAARSAFKPLLDRKVKLTKGSKITFTLPRTAKKYAKHIVMLLFFGTNEASFDATYGKAENGALSYSPPPFPSKGGIKWEEGGKEVNNGSKPIPPFGSLASLGKGKEVNKYSDQRDNPYVLFIKNQLGAQLGDQVRVKFTKIGSTFAIGKVVRISPNSSLKKMTLAKKNINEMLLNGMHYGEKVVKCQARMRNYIWNRKKGQNKNPLIKKGRHLINLLKTRRCLNIGLNQLTKYAAKGRTFLFVGTKKPAAGLIARAALFSKTSFFVNTRWLGGMLTNWKTIIKSISKIRPILKEKQKVISNILQKRAKIQNRLIKKVLSLRKKSTVLIKKGKQLIEKVSGIPINNKGLSVGLFEAKPQSPENSTLNSFSGLKKSEKLNSKRKELFERGQFLLQKRQNLLNKQNELKENTVNIKECGFLIATKYKVLLNKFKRFALDKKLHDIRLLFQLNKELRQIKKFAKEQGKNQYTLSYGKFKELSTLASEKAPNGLISSKNFWLIPNPPQEILNKILITINGLAYTFPPKVGEEGVKSDARQTQQIDGSSINVESLKVANTTSLTLNVKEKNMSSSLKNAQMHLNKSITAEPLIVLTKLLSKFSRFLPYIKNAINSTLRVNHEGIGIIQVIEEKLKVLKANLKNLKIKLIDYLRFNNKINTELELIQKKYTSEQQIIRILRRKLKRHEAEKKLLQFLPKLRYLPTPKSQISLAIQLLMKRFVDPKMKYPMDLIYDEKLKKKSKKVAAARKKKWQRLETYFGGIANMTKLKKTQISKNVAIIIGQQEEMNAVRECKKLGIKMFHIVDTNCNPGLADHFIPSNDDSQNSIKFILTKIITRIRLAQKIRLRFKLLSNKKSS